MFKIWFDIFEIIFKLFIKMVPKIFIFKLNLFFYFNINKLNIPKFIKKLYIKKYLNYLKLRNLIILI